MTRLPQPHKRRGLAFRLTLLILTSSTLIFMAAFGYNYLHSRQLMLKETHQSSMNLARTVVLQIETRLRTVEAMPRMVARHVERLSDDGELTDNRLQTLVQDMLAGTPDIFGATAAFEPNAFENGRLTYAPYVHRDETGRPVLSRLDGKTYNYFLWDWYLLPKELDRPVWSEPYFDKGGGGIIMATYSQPFYSHFDQRRLFRGVVTADISLEELVAQINAISLYKTGYAFLVSHNGAYLAHPDKNLIMRESIFSLAEASGLPKLRDIGRKMIQGRSGFASLVSVYTKKRSLMVYAPVKATGWSVGVVIAENELFADLRNLNHTVLAIAIVGFVLLLIVIVTISRSITRPLHLLVSTTEEIAQGNLDVVMPNVRTKDEVELLTHSVDGMRLALKAYIADIAETSRARERIESELKIANAIQMNFLPKHFPPFPDQPAFDIYAALLPAREVGGDLYDFFMLDENHLFFSVGDVSDKGVPAALFMAVTKTLMKGIAEQGLTPADVLERVNVELCLNNEAAMFVTVACGILDISTGEVQYSNAGHNPPVLLRRGQVPEFLPMPPGLVLGAIEEVSFENREVRLDPGDRLVLYTDGVTEAMDDEKQLFSEKRLLKDAARLAETDPKHMVEQLVAAVASHAGGCKQSDDITLMAFHYKGRQDRSAGGS